MSDLKRFEDIDAWRWYCKDDDKSGWYISCTKVLDSWTPQKVKSYLINNTKNKIEKTLVETADIGTRIHEVIESDLKGITPIDLTGIEKPFDNWLKMKDEFKIKATMTEQFLYSDKMGVAGTADIIGEFAGKPVVMDIKTGFYGIKAGPQMVMYLKMAQEMKIVDDSFGVVGLSIHRDGNIAKPIIYEHTDWIFKTFTSCLELFKAENFYKLQGMKWKWLHNNSNKHSIMNEQEVK